ncbi:transposase [Streptomyces sp. NPDC051597]|uniref:transposase n=1 Tax=Streptomyces sp. NPDC051597 TaxID=3155049 RepID=UPI003445BBBB
MLESALKGEITDHVGYHKHEQQRQFSQRHPDQDGADRRRPGRGEGPRDVAGTFEPQIVKKRQRRLASVDEIVLSLSAKDPTHGEVSAHLARCTGRRGPGRPSPRSRTR